MKLSRLQRDPDTIDEETFGIAFKAFDTVEKRDVCLKYIKPKILTGYKELVLQEIEILQKLDHPNIVKYFGHFFEEEKLYIVLEYIEGGDLKSYLRKNKPPLSEEIVLSFFSQLVSGLSYAHSFKIIHRDLKPANILLTKDNQIKIIDFNSAKMVQTLCPTSDKLVEIPGYVALEVLKQEDHSFPVDIWFLECVIYELMTGKPPFFDNYINQLQKMLETQDTPSIEGNYSCILKFIVLKMLEKIHRKNNLKRNAKFSSFN
jgi:serine/threonine protein kinase